MFHIHHKESYQNEYCCNDNYYIININPELLIKDLILEIYRKFKIKEGFKLYKKKNKELKEIGESEILSNYLYEIIYMN